MASFPVKDPGCGIEFLSRGGSNWMCQTGASFCKCCDRRQVIDFASLVDVHQTPADAVAIYYIIERDTLPPVGRALPPRLRSKLVEALRRWWPDQGFADLREVDDKALDYILRQMTSQAMFALKFLVTRERASRHDLANVVAVLGVAKSMLTADFAAAVSSARPWGPDGITMSGDVVIVSPEDDARKTLKPRLIASGGREDRIHVVSTERGVPELGAILEAADALPNLKLLILDPITACLSGRDLNRADGVHALLMPVADWAEKRGVGVVLVTHLNKTVGRSPLGRILGSQAFGAVARAVFLVCPDALNNQQRLVLPVKDNIGITQQPLVFRIEEVMLPGRIATARTVFEATRPDLTTRDALAALQRPSQAASALEEAMTFLRSFLACDEQSMTAVRDAALAHGISPASLRRARETLAIRPRKNGTRGGWVWGLPTPSTGGEKPGLHGPTVSKVTTAAEDAPAHGTSIFDPHEHLRHGERGTENKDGGDSHLRRGSHDQHR